MFGLISFLILVAVVWAVVISAFIAYNTACWSFVLAKCWLWLAVPAFGMVALTFPQAVAVGMFISIIGAKIFVPPNEIFSLKTDDDLSEDEKAEKKKIGYYKLTYFVIIPWATLAITWLVKILFI